jgi:hypothetical protein
MPAPPKAPKTVGGRFPAIEQALDDWIDSEIYAGRDVRDQQARDKAKDLARDIGFIENRFKGSAKWFDKVSSSLTPLMIVQITSESCWKTNDRGHAFWIRLPPIHQRAICCYPRTPLSIHNDPFLFILL